MTATIDAAADSGSDHDARQNEEPQDMQKEILPDTIVGLLRRMAEEIRCSICAAIIIIHTLSDHELSLGTMNQPQVTPCNHTFCNECIRQALVRREECPLCKNRFSKRSLNSVEHLEKVINAFHDLTAAYALEYGQSLSQAPRHYDAEPIENLTQFFPYPEKDDGSSPKPTTPPADEEESATQENRLPEPTTTPPSETTTITAMAATTTTTTTTTAITTATATTTVATTDQETPAGLDFSCFDVDLDSLSTEDAALLAEQMLNMMLHSEYDSQQPTHVSSSESSDHRIQQPPPEQPESSQVLPVKQEEDEQCLPTQAALSTQPMQPTQPSQITQGRSSLAKFNPEFATSFPQSYSESFFADIPTQEQASAEAKIVLCGTYLSTQKKNRMETVARSLKAKVIDDIYIPPTHVVMDMTQEQSRKGCGRTVKFFLGVLRACWVLRYEWIDASMRAGYWVDEEQYQIHDNEMGCNAPKRSRASQLGGDPPLFTGCEFQLSGVFTTPKKEEVALMIRAGGGMVVPQLFLGDTRLSKSIRAHDDVSANHSGARTSPHRHLIVHDLASNGVVSLKKLRTEVESMRKLADTLGKRIELVQCKSLLDCIAQYDMSTLVESNLP
ncbi:hypothetical protein EC968_002774 [Mortierella alpina]|nr:hypothetical protein EC968_002774 [Mortierella alpina]